MDAVVALSAIWSIIETSAKNLCLGAIIPVAPGRMRNIWYPQQMAEYMTESQLKEVPELIAERDFTFGMAKERGEDEAEEEEMVDVQMKLLAVGCLPERFAQAAAYIGCSRSARPSL